MRFEWEKWFSSQIINRHTTPAIPRVHVEITIHLKIKHFYVGLRLFSHVVWLGTGQFQWSIGTNGTIMIADPLKKDAVILAVE